MARKPAKLTDEQANAERKKWNVPNWRNQEEYADIQELEGDRLRWEFVRRCTQYRTAWKAHRPYDHFDFGLKSWVNPCNKTSPEFIRACRVVEFPERTVQKQARHYDSLALNELEGGIIISVDIFHPLKPQLKFIEAIYKRKQEHFIPPAERKGRPNRRTNAKGRKPSTLLRVLDAHNEGIPINEMADVFGGRNGINESAMRRTIDFANTFWRRL